ncbi:MFS transporter [Chryseobacterium pennipullorum]|uniref:MFS transporter n=1 Tax=Chryseobacterium pennipullorum TaxID=2258963 RepID=A0A3D9ARV4_9FLAO|nr:MFS transporter [Chryseobacterium pennipullorum]REC44070.1 MFS transporter [Chryseobacterium pennipullorum]
MTVKLSRISLPLKLTFLIFSMVLNCMGLIILQLSEAKITYSELGLLESFKDLPIAFISLFAVGLINKTGTKKALISALAIVGFCCCLLPFIAHFWFYKVWFAIIGACFAIGKICVFGIIRNNISDEKSLAKTMSNVEASFMIGIFVVNTGFGWLISSRYSEFWKFGFLMIAALSAVTIFLLSKADLSESRPLENKNIFSELSGFATPAVALFLGVIFFIVFVEQGFNSWLPSFYKNHLKVNSFFALQATSFLAIFSYVGRTVTANIIRRFPLRGYYMTCMLFIVALLAAILGIQYFESADSRLILFLFPMVGFFLSPLYPVINSKMIAQVDKEKVNLFTSLIVIFSSLGSSVSSIIMAVLFGNQLLTFYPLYILSSVILLFVMSLIYFSVSKRNNRK